MPKRFFNLDSFAHKDLFLMEKPVWESLKNLKGYLSSLNLGKIECKIPSSAILIHSEMISIGKGTVVEPGAYIEGPCSIGENCQIRHGAYIRGNIVAGNRCIIGHATEVKHTIFLDDARAPHFNYVGDSILGNHVNIGAGVICANFRLDRGEVVIELDGDLYKTGLRKFGTVVGDGSQIGCNCVINPGALLEKKTYSKGCTSIQKSNLRENKEGKTGD